MKLVSSLEQTVKKLGSMVFFKYAFLTVFTVIIWFPEIINYIAFLPCLSGGFPSAPLFDTTGISAATIANWQTNTILSVAPLYNIYYVLGYPIYTYLGNEITGYTTFYASIRSVPITGQFPLFGGSWVLNTVFGIIGWNVVFEIVTLAIGAAMIYWSFSKAKPDFTILGIVFVIMGIIVLLGYACMELKTFLVIFPGVYLILLGRKRHRKDILYFGIILLLSAIAMYAIFLQMSQVTVVLDVQDWTYTALSW